MERVEQSGASERACGLFFTASFQTDLFHRATDAERSGVRARPTNGQTNEESGASERASDLLPRTRREFSSYFFIGKSII